MFYYIHAQIMLIALFVSVACALPGVFLVLRGIALMSDAISHAILLGIILMFFVVKRLDSPMLMFGAACAGLLTVICTQGLIKTRRVKEDAAIGLVFPLFFSIGVILISLYARNVHLDTDMVLLGEIAFAPFNRFSVDGIDMGPVSLWVMGIVILLNGLFIRLFYKELSFSIFDESGASVVGIWPTALYYGLMAMTSVTAVGAFDIVGSIVVVALMVTPAASAYLWSVRVSTMLWLSVLLSAASAILGCAFAFYLDVSIAGSIAMATGLLFTLSFIFSPQKGILARYLHHRAYRQKQADRVVAAILQGYSPGYELSALTALVGWKPTYIAKVTTRLEAQNMVRRLGGRYVLTKKGRNWLRDGGFA